MKIVRERLTIIFDEWARRYAENPDEFIGILDDDGNPVPTYGEAAALYVERLAKELDEKGLLPIPSPAPTGGG